MKFIDAVRSIDPPISEREMENCVRHGECSQCGLCCIIHDIELPIRIPNDVSEPVELFKKEVFEVCPHLRPKDGRLQCGAHEVKGHPSLKICSEWRGSWVRNYPWDKESNYSKMMNFFWENVLDEDFDLNLADLMVQRGLTPFPPEPHQISWRRVIRLIEASLSLPELPVALLDKLELDKFLLRIQVDWNHLLSILDLNKPVHLAFKERYIVPKRELALKRGFDIDAFTSSSSS